MFKMSVLIFHAGFAVDRQLGPHVSLGLFRNILPELLQDVDLQTITQLWSMHDRDLPHYLLPFLEILNNFSGRLDRTRWTNSVTLFVPLLKYLRCLSLRISKVDCLFCRIQ